MAGCVIVFGYKEDLNTPTKESIDAISKYIQSILIVKPNNEVYNYSNVLAEIREGDDLQAPLSYFQVAYFDKIYGTVLYGPFDVTGNVLRITNFNDNTGFDITGVYEFPLAGAVAGEGSADNRSGQSFSAFAGSDVSSSLQSAAPVTHIVQNSNVDQVYLTIGVRALNDTNQIDMSLPGTGTVQAGSSLPTVVRFKVEIGLQDSLGRDIPGSIEERIYQIMGISSSASLVDIGRAEVSNILNNYTFLDGTVGNKQIDASTAINLPAATATAKRFIRVTRTTYETSSVLLKRTISLEKVTEIINTKFAYPGSAIIGVKLDSRDTSSIPARAYDLRLKKVLIPSNYFPLHPDGRDRRRYKGASDFSAATSLDLQIYQGNWDGTFKLAWTDNPAWVLFDMLINPHYGLGSFIDASQVNVWELYKIGRFCDGVDMNGVFQGVDNSYGGKEPRYSINIILADKINIFDTLNAIATVFRGNVFYSNSYVDFTDDRLKIPIMEFSNTNVKDGIFSYTNSRIDQQFNVAQVAYLDENNNFNSAIAYVEDADDIRNRGILSTQITTFGVTSFSLANRIGQHIIYATTNENQAVSFVGGMESLFLKPGDLISINDELKTQQRNFGRVLDIDSNNGRVYINERFPSGYVLNEITLLAPTGIKTFDEMAATASASGGITFKDIYESDVPQCQTFKISGYDNSIEYGSNIYILPQTTYNIITFEGNTNVTGLYSGLDTGNGLQLYSGISNTGYCITNGITGQQFWSLSNLSTSGVVCSGASGLSQPYAGNWTSGGCFYSPAIDNSNINFLSRVKQGFPFSITMSGIDQAIYKVSSVRENNPNEYEVSAIRFDTGKFAMIEGTQSLQDFYSAFPSIGAQTPTSPTVSIASTYQLATPPIIGLTILSDIGNILDVSGSWSGVAGATSYSINITTPNGSNISDTTTNTNYVLRNQTQLGFYRLSVTAKNPTLGFTSLAASSGQNIYASSSYSTPYIKNITIY